MLGWTVLRNYYLAKIKKHSVKKKEIMSGDLGLVYRGTEGYIFPNIETPTSTTTIEDTFISFLL